MGVKHSKNRMAKIPVQGDYGQMCVWIMCTDIYWRLVLQFEFLHSAENSSAVASDGSGYQVEFFASGPV